MEVLTREKFFTAEQEAHSLPQGLTIDEMMAAVNWKSELRPWTRVSVEGQDVPEHLWRTARPKRGNRVFIGLVPAGVGGGGGSGKQIAMAVGAIVIMVAAMWAAPLIVGSLVGSAGWTAASITAAYPLTTALVGAGIGVVGNLALGALVKPPKLGPQTLGQASSINAASESNTYDVKGSSNALNPYGVVPRVYGRHRVTPPLAAEPYIVSSGTAQTIHLLLDFGYGPLLVEDIRIGNTPIAEFTTARWEIHPYYTSGQPLSIYLNDQATMDVNAVLTQGQDNVRAVPQAGSTIVLEFQFPGGLIEFNDQGASFQKDDHVTVFAAPSADPTAWQPISDFSPYALFTGEGGSSTAGQAQVASFGTYIWNKSPFGFVTSDPAARNLPTGALFHFDGANYTIQGIEDPAPNNPGQILVKLDRNPDGVTYIWTNTGILPGLEGAQGTVTTYAGGVILGPLTVTFGPSPYDVEFHGQTRSPRTVSIVMQMPYEDQWRVMVRRSTPVSNSSLISNAISWGTMRSGRWSSPIYPRSMRTIMEVAITATEQVSGQLQGINALCTSILWDARLNIMSPTRNPALIYQDILTGQGNPRPVPWNRIDQTKCLIWADNNDSISAQGDTRNTCDIVVDFRTTISDLCQTVCAAGRAAPTMRDGLYSVMEEEENRVPVQMFTNRNARDWSSNRVWVDYPHALRVKYTSEDTWNQEEMFVYADGYSGSNASRFETLEMSGIVRPWQVWRAARYYLATAMLRREKLSILTDVENLVCQRGDLIRVAHDRLLSNIVVRAREVDGATITHDGIVDWAALTPSVNVTQHGDYLPANAGAQTAAPTGWLIANFASVGGLASVLDKGVDEHGHEWVDIWIRSNTPTSSVAGTIAIRPGPANPNDFIMWDDSFFWEQRASLHDGADIAAANVAFGLFTQPLTPYGTTGLGTFTYLSPLAMSAVGGPDLTRDYFMAMGRAGAPSASNRPNAARNQVQFRVTIGTAGTHYDFVVRMTGSKVAVLNRKDWLLTRVEAAGWNAVPHSEGEGAVPGVISGGGSGLPPTGWGLQNWAGWTVTVTTHTRVWDHYDTEIRFQAAAGAADCVFRTGGDIDITPTKIVGTSVHLQQIAIVGTAPTYSLGLQLLAADDSFLFNSLGGTFTLAVGTTVRQSIGGNFAAAYPTAAKARLVFRVAGAAGQATDVTIRFRLPVAQEGITTDPLLAIAAFPQETETGWFANIRDQDGNLIENEPIVLATAPDKIIFGNPTIYDNIRPGDIIAIGQLNTETSRWLVDKITPGPDFSATIDMVEEAPGIYLADTGPIPPYVPNNGDGILRELAGVTNMILSSALFKYNLAGEPIHNNLIRWDPPIYEVDYYLVSRLYEVLNPGASIPPPNSLENVKVEIARTNTPNWSDDVDARTMRSDGTTIRYFVTPVTVTGRRGAEMSVSDVFFPDTVSPPAVKFTTNVLSETTMLIWERPSIPDLAGYQIRFIDQEYQDSLGVNPAWERMISVVDNVSPVLTSLTVHSQTGTYAIRVFDTSGNYGTPSYSTTKIGLLPNVNEVTRLVEGPTWAGTFDRTEIVTNELRLRKDPQGNFYTEGWFYATSAVNYPASWVFRVRGALEAYALPLTPDPKGDWNVQVWVSIQKFAPRLNSAWFTPLQTAVPLAGGADTYIPLGAVANTDLEGRLINWAIRLISRRADLTPSLRKATLIVDHSERREFGSDRATGTGGLSIPFAYPFFDVPATSVTLNDGQPGDRIVKSTSTTALTVEVFTSAGVSVNRKIDWQAIGYGRGVT